MLYEAGFASEGRIGVTQPRRVVRVVAELLLLTKTEIVLQTVKGVEDNRNSDEPYVPCRQLLLLHGEWPRR